MTAAGHHLPPYALFPVAAGVALALAVTLGGCGAAAHPAGPETSGGGSGRALLVRQADRICKSAALAIGAISVPANRSRPAPEEAAYIVDVSTAITERETRELQRLKVPPEAAAAWRAFITAQVRGDQIAHALKARVDAHDTASAALLPSAAVAAATITAAANALGAPSCAGPGTPLTTP